ncbi:MAG: alpha/beta hydrolase [Cyanobacteria bacterium J06642_12]
MSELSLPVRHILDLPHIKLACLEWNRGREPVLLVHGLGDNAWVWANVGEALSDRYHVIAVDLRGHGDSDKPEEGYGFDTIASDLMAVIDAMGWSSAHVVGHSLGGKLVARWVQTHPERFRSAVLVDPFFAGRLPAWSELSLPLLYRVLPFLQGMGPFESYEVAERTARQLKQYRDWSPLQQTAFRAGIEQKPDGQWGSKFTVRARDRMFVESIRVASLTAPVEVPTLIIRPEKGLNRMEWQLTQYRTYLPNLEISNVPGHHWPFLVEPKAFEQAIVDFLANH